MRAFIHSSGRLLMMVWQEHHSIRWLHRVAAVCAQLHGVWQMLTALQCKDGSNPTGEADGKCRIISEALRSRL